MNLLERTSFVRSLRKVANADNTGTLQQGSITAAMPKAKGGCMGMLPIRHTCQALQVKAVAAGRNVLNTCRALIGAAQLLSACSGLAIFTLCAVWWERTKRPRQRGEDDSHNAGNAQKPIKQKAADGSLFCFG